MRNPKTVAKLTRLSIISLSLTLFSIFTGYAQGSNCSITTFPTGSGDTMTVCITVPSDGATIMGVTSVTATVSVTGTTPSLSWAEFNLDSLDNTQKPSPVILTDYVAPSSKKFTFQLPSAHF